MLKANDFFVFHMPRMPTKKLNQRFKAGLPDFICIGKIGGINEGKIFIAECKVGSGTQTATQKTIMTALLRVPGVCGGVFYPSDYDRLVKDAGGREPL